MASFLNRDFTQNFSESDEETESSSSSNNELLSEDDNDTCEPLATEEEAAEYHEDLSREAEEEAKLQERFSSTQEIKTWCKCTHCDTEFIVKPSECSCCLEFDRCREKMEEIDQPDCCITSHQAFEDICLKTWVLEVAAIGLRTKKKALYTTLRAQGRKSDSDFFRAVAYRQFVRFVWDYVGNSMRIPLPCCVYNKIRSTFPSETEEYKGFEEEEEEDDQETEEEEEEEDEDL